MRRAPVPRGIRRLFELPWRTRAQIAREVDLELDFHLEMRVADLVARGLDAEAARRQARAEFGDLERTRAYCRAQDDRAERATRAGDRLGELRQDVRYAWRALRRAPAFAAVSIVTLALAIGATTAIFSVARAVLLRPLPFGAPESLVALYEGHAAAPAERVPLAAPNYADLRAQQHTLADAAAYLPRQVTWRPADGDPAVVRAMTVTANIFRVLRVGALHGRTFAGDEDRPGAAAAVVVSEDFWRRALGGDPAAVGRRLTLDDRTVEVIGVLPRGVTLGAGEEMWLPLDLSDAMATPERSRKQHYLGAVARLREGVTLDAARADLLAVARRLAAQYPESNTGRTLTLVPLHRAMAGDLRAPLLLLLGAAGLVLLIACANLANVTLSRASSRRRELAVRAAIGAGRGRLTRQLLTESALLGVAGGAAGVALAVVGTRALLALNPETLPPAFADVAVDGRVLLFSLALSVGTGIAVGLVPALQASRLDLPSSLKEGGRGASGGRAGERARRSLVVAQMALAVVLLSGAGLLLRSFRELTRVRLGFDPEHVLTAQLRVGGARYDSAAAVNRFYDGVLDELRRSPGVVAAGGAIALPMSGKPSSTLRIEGEPFDATNPPEVRYFIVRGDYFAALRVPLRAGRLFDDTDRPGGPKTVVLNEAAVRRFFPTGTALGRRLRLGPDPDGPWSTVVGIVGDMREEGLDVEPTPTAFVNHRQETWWHSLGLVVRTAGDARAAVPALRQAVAAVDRTLALRDVRPLEDLVSASLAARRFALGLASSFALLALVLAAVGIYGVLAYAVTTRTREFGVRLALGATGPGVVLLVLRQGLAWSLLGLTLGLGAALAGGPLLGSMLYGVRPTDATTFAQVAAGLLAVVLLACVVPALRATRVDPLTSLRAE